MFALKAAPAHTCTHTLDLFTFDDSFLTWVFVVSNIVGGLNFLL